MKHYSYLIIIFLFISCNRSGSANINEVTKVYNSEISTVFNKSKFLTILNQQPLLGELFVHIEPYSKDEIEKLGEEIEGTGQYLSLYLRDSILFKDLETYKINANRLGEAIYDAIDCNVANAQALSVFQYYKETDFSKSHFPLNLHQNNLNRLYRQDFISLEDYKNLSVLNIVLSISAS